MPNRYRNPKNKKSRVAQSTQLFIERAGVAEWIGACLSLWLIGAIVGMLYAKF